MAITFVNTARPVCHVIHGVCHHRMGRVERHDVIVVGARCAGSPLATMLARRGLDVAVVDRATFPSDTLSTHIFQAEGLNVLRDLGVLPDLLATGAPFVGTATLHIDDLTVMSPWPTRDGDAGPTMCIRRPVLDSILVANAEDAGAHVRTGARVTGLVERDGRVAGV